MVINLGKPFPKTLIPAECSYIKFPAMGFYIYEEKNGELKCFAVSNDSKE